MSSPFSNPLVFGFHVGTLWDTRIRISPLTLFILFWMGQALGWQIGLVAFAVLLLITLCHEFFHVFAARLTGGDSDEVILWPLGGLAMCRTAPTFQSEFLTPAAGPIFHLLACLILVGPLHASTGFTWHPIYFPDVDLASRPLEALGLIAFTLNWKLLLLNLLPVFPLDGSGMVLAAARQRWESVVARGVSLIVSAVAHVILATIALNIDATAGRSLLLLCYILLPITILEYIKMQAAAMMGYEVYDSESPLDEDEDEGHARPPRPVGFFERWRLERERKRQEREEQERITAELQLDLLLDKVHREGMNSLTEAEKRFLKKTSARYRGTKPS